MKEDNKCFMCGGEYDLNEPSARPDKNCCGNCWVIEHQ